MAIYNRHRHLSAMDPRPSSQDGIGGAFSLVVILAVLIAVLGLFYMYSGTGPTTVAETNTTPALTHPVTPPAVPATEEETRPTQAPMP